MKKIFLNILLLTLIFGCNESEEIAFSEKVETTSTKAENFEEDKLRIYREAIQNESTIQDFIVIKVINSPTGEEKEICTKGIFLKGALHREYGINYSQADVEKVNKILLETKDRIFKLSKVDALNNIGYYDYNQDELKAFEKRVETESITYSNDKEMTMFAHMLFNKGVKSSENSCFGGDLIYKKQ